MKILKETTVLGAKLETVEDDGKYYYQVNGQILAEISEHEARHPEETIKIWQPED